MERKNKRLFISRPAGPLLRSWCAAHRIELIDFSLIDFHPIFVLPQHVPNVIFYSSPRSVQFSSEIRKIFPDVLSAAIGEATACSLKEKGVLPQFIGRNAADPAGVAEEFAKWLGNRRVLFPVSAQSVGTVSSVIPEAQKEVVSVYETIGMGRSVPLCDYYVFSSPSNWESFLVENSPSSGTVFAWGKTTGNTILNSGIVQPVILAESSEECLIQELIKLVE